MVVHTGVQSKLIMNLGQYNMKVSTIEKRVNYVLALNVIILLLGCVISTFLHVSFDRKAFGSDFEN